MDTSGWKFIYSLQENMTLTGLIFGKLTRVRSTAFVNNSFTVFYNSRKNGLVIYTRLQTDRRTERHIHSVQKASLFF